MRAACLAGDDGLLPCVAPRQAMCQGAGAGPRTNARHSFLVLIRVEDTLAISGSVPKTKGKRVTYDQIVWMIPATVKCRRWRRLEQRNQHTNPHDSQQKLSTLEEISSIEK
jgi:hypothetical protein